MRAVKPKHPDPPPIKLKPGPPDAYNNRFAAVARCTCGHVAQLPHKWVALAAGYGQELQQARARLRCGKCGGRNPRVDVYRVAQS
jgi:hypothetical protein